MTAILYIFQGLAKVNEEYELEKGEMIVFKDKENLNIKVGDGSEIVLFLTDELSNFYSDGMYSGNKTN